MFIHIGGDVIVSVKQLIGIFDLEKTTVLQETRNFLKTAEEEGFVMTIGDDMPKSFVLVETDLRYQVYLSPISPATLHKRWKKNKSTIDGINHLTHNDIKRYINQSDRRAQIHD